MPANDLRVITEENFQSEVLDSPIPVLVDFATPWCPPCRVIAPILRELAAETEGRARIGHVSAEECSSLAVRYSVRGYPTVIAFGGGVEKARRLGATNKETLRRMIEACL